jgi:ferric-dicitrate binding protein FerR (iron transport regulator)
METIWSLIGRKLEGEVSTEEEKALNDWINAETTNKQVYFQLKELWNHKQDQTNNSHFYPFVCLSGLLLRFQRKSGQ